MSPSNEPGTPDLGLVSFDHADEIGDRFLSLLHRLGIDPPSKSDIEHELLSLTQLIEITKNPNLATGPERISILRQAAGIHDLASKVLSVELLDEFQQFVPHLRLISEYKVPPFALKPSHGPSGSLSQNTASGVFDDTARKITELYVGCLAAHAGTGVELDSPTNAKGDNPDVIFRTKTAQNTNPEQWALAIKAISSSEPPGQSIFDLIKAGAKQIDVPACRADRGLVIINAKTALDHDALWNASFGDLDAARAALGVQLERLMDAAASDRDQSEWDQLFLGKVARPVIFMGQTLVRLPTSEHSATPTALKMLKAYGAQGRMHPIGEAIAKLLNEFMQSIRRGIPGDVGKLPR